MLEQPVRHGQGGLLGRIRPALNKESLAWLIKMSCVTVEAKESLNGFLDEWNETCRRLRYVSLLGLCMVAF